MHESFQETTFGGRGLLHFYCVAASPYKNVYGVVIGCPEVYFVSPGMQKAQYLVLTDRIQQSVSHRVIFIT